MYEWQVLSTPLQKKSVRCLVFCVVMKHSHTKVLILFSLVIAILYDIIVIILILL